jgi:ribonuclease E
MSKKMLINASHLEECRVAVVSDGILEDLDIQISTRESTLGNIYKGVVNRIEPSLQAVFVDYGSERNGFLSINDIHPSYFPESFHDGRRRPRVQDVFKKGDDVVIQITKEERDNKGAGLTTNLSIAGRYLVLMPGTELMAVSRKIEDEKERKKLKDILKQLKLPENMGFIVRTAGQGRTKTELSRDLDYLLKLWKAIENNMGRRHGPELLYREQDVVIRSIREYFSRDISEILVDDKEVFKKARHFFEQVMPRYKNTVKFHQEKRPLFNKYQLEGQIEDVYRKRINLKSGGYIVIEPTEAMVTVDVNSGSATKERDIEETAFRVNLEAAEEIGRQLRLRDLGGIIVLDFIDMMHKKHNQEVEKALKAVLKKDRARSRVLKISSLGVLELSRQRLKSALGTGEYLDCPLCNGRGMIRSPEMIALSVFRKIKSLVIKTDISGVRAAVPARVAEYLLNEMRSQIVEMESQYSSKVIILAEAGMSERDITIEAVKEISAAQPTAMGTEIEPEAPESGLGKENQSTADQDKKRTKKPSRRRRRGKRKPTAGQEEAVSGEPAAAQMQQGTPEQVKKDTEPLVGPVAEDKEADPILCEPNSVYSEQEEFLTLEEEILEESIDIVNVEEEQTRKSKSKSRFASLKDFLPFS